MRDENNVATNLRMFSTRDRDNDIHVTKTCSVVKKSGWWHGKCTNVKSTVC